MLVFGESVLNDAASVVLYRTFDHLPPDNINVEQIGLGIASFFVVSIGGTLIGKERYKIGQILRPSRLKT